jgi:MFS transporter, SET family, sugar efflux transporter
MLNSLAPLWRDPALRLVVLMLVLTGAQMSSIAPYLSVIAISKLGFSNQSYSLILITASLISLASAVAMGILTDQHPLRRQMALLSAALVTIGTALMWLLPSKLSFAMAHALLLPMGFTLFVLVLALSRIATQHYPSSRHALLSAVRATFALPFVVVLPLWALALNSGADVMAIYPFACAVGVLTLAVIWAGWPPDGAVSPSGTKSGLSFFQSLKEIAERPVLLRVFLLGAAASAGTLYMVLIGLVFSQTPGRGTSDTALYVGLVAGAEVPFMLLVPQLWGHVSKPRMIAIGIAIYCIHLVLLPQIAASAAVWLLILPASLGGAIILTLPIAYLQDLLASRPGAGSSLISLQRVIGDTLAAGAFAIGTYASGYAFAACLGSTLALGGGLGLFLADRARQSTARRI